MRLHEEAEHLYDAHTGSYYPCVNVFHHITSFWPALLLLAPIAAGQPSADTMALPDGIEATGDTAEVNALRVWAREHLRSRPERAESVARHALELSRNLSYQRGIAGSLMTLGHLTSDLNLAEAYYTEAQEALERSGDESALIRNLINFGNIRQRRGGYRDALAYYFEALEGLKRLGDGAGQVSVLNNIGNAHRGQGNLKEALAHYERAVTLAETLDKPDILTYSLNNLGTTLTRQGSYENAEVHLRRALAIAEEERYQRYAASVSNNLGFLFNRQGRYERALSFLFAAESLAKEVEEEEEILFAVYDELGKAYMGLGEENRALRYATEALALARETQSMTRQMVAHETLSQLYEAAGDYVQALAHQRQYAVARDSVFTTEKAEITTEMQTRYETEEKQRSIERLEQENRIQALQTSRWRTWMIAGVGSLLLLLAFLFSRYRLEQRAKRLLEELDAAKSRFFANVSHEFRTPLTLLRGPLEDQVKGLSPSQETTQAMLRNTRRMEQLVDEVLDLNRLRAGKLDLELVADDLVRTLRRLIEADAPLAERNGIELTFEHEVGHCPRFYDPEKLKKIVGNLLSNALKFTPRGRSVRVALRCAERIEICVADDGPGIPLEMQKNVFERFAQVQDGALHGGTGIGLALAKELAELHGGTITLESTPGEGSTFTVRLPLKETTLDDVQRTAPLRGLSRRQGGTSPKEELEVGGDGESPSPSGRGDRGEGLDRTTVLIIEDNADVRAYVRTSLEEVYGVLEAADGETGLQQARVELPDLIISDVMLPGIDGYEIARRLKAETLTECIPVVMLTARAAEEDQTEGYGSGAEVYITKPFLPKTLRAAVARLLEERLRLRRRLQEAGSQTEETERENGKPTLADRARAVVFENLYDEGFGVEELASTLGMSLRTLQRRLKPEVGFSPSDFVRTLRLERARDLLSGGAGSVSEVAYAVGFNSLVAFSRAYSAHYGMPPSVHLGKGQDTR